MVNTFNFPFTVYIFLNMLMKQKVHSRPTTVIASIQYVAVSEQRYVQAVETYISLTAPQTRHSHHNHYSKFSHLFSPHCKIY
jgi:hypothetical protein